MTQYAYRKDRGSFFCITDDISDARDSGDVFVLGEKLTTQGVEMLRHEKAVEDAKRDVARAEERMRAAEDRLRIERLRAEPPKETT